MNSQVAQSATAYQSDLPGIISQTEQLKAFRRARRHSLLVRLMKYLLPACCLVVVASYGVLYQTKVVTEQSIVQKASIGSLSLSSEGLKMINPSYTGHQEKLGRYRIDAEYALQNIDAPHRLNMHKITGLINHPDKKWTKLEADSGRYDTKSEEMTLDGGILITSNRGLEAKLVSADVDVKKQVIRTSKPVMMRVDKNRITANNMILWNGQKRVLFKGNVKMRLYRQQSGAGASLLRGKQ